MEEATFRKKIFRGLAFAAHYPFARARRPRLRGKGRSRRSQRGQGFLEFLLVLLLSVGFLRFVFFNKDYGMKAQLDKTMLTLGSYLEANLKSGTKPGGNGTKSLEAFAGTKAWKN